MTVESLPKICHRCGADVEESRWFMYERTSGWEVTRARCARCDRQERREEALTGLLDSYNQLVRAYQRLLSVTDEQRRRDE